MSINVLKSPEKPILSGKLYGNWAGGDSCKLERIHHTTSYKRHPFAAAFASVKKGKLFYEDPAGNDFIFAGEDEGYEAHLKLYDIRAFDAFMARGEIGLAEAYMDGLWESDNLHFFIGFMLENYDVLEDYFYGKPLYSLLIKAKNFFNGNSLSGSRRNIAGHYDLGNDFYELWLDKSMTYSCAIFGNNPRISLEEAQKTKYYRILDKLDTVAGEHILEIGCGWGGFAEVAAADGINVSGITISQEQYEYVQRLIEESGISDYASIEFKDYREVKGIYDHIVSIGMFEHVGKKYWKTYFDTIKEHLKPYGSAMVQTITIDEEVARRTSGKNGFIETYIFQGGELPTKKEFFAAAEEAGLVCSDVFPFGQDYALTLSHWLKRFDSNVNKIRSIGYSDRFIRMWRLYLSGCIASFATGRTDVMQVKLQHG